MSSESAKLRSEVTTSEMEFPSLNENVTIRRDGRGIPYIQAMNEADLFFAQGYATAYDRLWQMDFLRRMARGELAEILGPNALELDKVHRIYGFRKLAETLFADASTETRAVLESYASGVNAFISTRTTASLPKEFQVLGYAPQKWSPVDSLALGKLFAERLSVSADVDCLRALISDLSADTFEALFPRTCPLDLILVGTDIENSGCNVSQQVKLNEGKRTVLTAFLKAMRRLRIAGGGDTQAGSNAWIVSGKLTSSGAPMLANDPHLAPSSPSIWHITHLSTADFRVAGVSVPGVPGVMIGHNEHIAWGLTNLCPDVQDLYFEEFDEADSWSYKTPEGWRSAESRKEEIKVRSSRDAMETVTIDVKITRHGPVVFENGSIGLAMRWTALETDVIDLETFIAINRARNWDEFRQALILYNGPPQNFAYADIEGHIGHHTAGRIPLRKTGDGSVPYDGTTDDGEWIEFIPLEELPHVFDPVSGIIVTANNRIVGDDYPHHLTHNWRVPYRARRIHDLLKDREAFTVSDFFAIQADTYSYPDAIFAVEIVKIGQSLVEESSEWREMVDALSGWDGYAKAESRVLPLVTQMRTIFRRYILETLIGPELEKFFEWRNEGTFIDRVITERPTDLLPQGFSSYESLILECYRGALASLAERLGPEPETWTWGKLESVRFPHPLEKLPSIGPLFAVTNFPQNTGGSMPTVNAGSKVSMRFVADLSDWGTTRLCLPLGESGELSSPHRDDQLLDWRQVTAPPLPFNDNDIAEACRNVFKMKPAST